MAKKTPIIRNGSLLCGRRWGRTYPEQVRRAYERIAKTLIKKVPHG